MKYQVLTGSIVVAAIAAASSADTIRVDDDARNDPGPGDPLVSDPLENGSVAHPFDSIQEAIDASSDGDTVLLAAGTYTGDGNRDLDFGGREITVRGESGAEKTIIDCQGAIGDPHRGFIFQNGELPAARLAALTITNGVAVNPGQGGAVRVFGGHPTIVGCRFIDNNAYGTIPDGDAAGGAVYSVGNITITDCEFIGNSVFADSSDVGRGGAIYAPNPTIDGCLFQNNGAGSPDVAYGGALFLYGSATVVDTVIDGNTASASCNAYGGGIWSSVAITMRRCRVTNNTARMSGGCAGNGTAIAGGARISGLIEDTIFCGNLAWGFTTAQGGGLVLEGEATVARCTIIGNSTKMSFGPFDQGAGVSGSGAGTRLLLNCLVARNVSSHGAGASGSLMLVGCTVADNILRDTDPPYYPEASGGALSGPVTAVNCVLWGNPEPAFTGNPTVSWSTAQGGYPGPGNLDADPLFLSPSAGRFELMSTSTAIDAADNTAYPIDVETDLAGNPRFVDDPDVPDTGVGTAPFADLGAIEQQGPPCAGDIDGNGTVDVDDLVQVITDWGACCPADTNGDGLINAADGHFGDEIVCPFCPADMSNSGDVDVDDLVQVITDWGDCE